MASGLELLQKFLKPYGVKIKGYESGEDIQTAAPYVGMGEVKAAERRTPYTLAELRQIDDAIGKAIRPEPAVEMPRPYATGAGRTWEPEISMPVPYVGDGGRKGGGMLLLAMSPRRWRSGGGSMMLGLVMGSRGWRCRLRRLTFQGGERSTGSTDVDSRGGHGSFSNEWLQKNSTPVVEMPNPYGKYDNIDSSGLPAGQMVGGGQVAGRLSLGSVIPRGSFNYNQTETETPIPVVDISSLDGNEIDKNDQGWVKLSKQIKAPDKSFRVADETLASSRAAGCLQ